jgi:Ni,Fe-hydrogenase I large subunit
MARDPLVIRLQEELGATILARRLAQVLELRVIARALAGGAGKTGCMASGWPAGAGVGMGRAVTARGPVYHRVRLAADRDTVADWRVLAPTDWHFSPTGPVARALPAMRDPAAIRALVGAFDPCAPWALQPPAGGG